MSFATVPAGTPRVLIVDDDGQIRQLLAGFLKENGLDVLLARDGVEMRAALSSQAIDLIVLDLMLPAVSGTEILRILRTDTRWRHLPCIVLTAAGQDAQLREVESLGVSEIMTKPFSPRRLLERVRAYTGTTLAEPARAELPSAPVVP